MMRCCKIGLDSCIGEAHNSIAAREKTGGRETMTTQEFKEAFKIAESDVDTSHEDLTVFYEFGLSRFQPVTVTLHQVAALIRWQARRFNGGWDNEALNEVRTAGRRKFVVVGA